MKKIFELKSNYLKTLPSLMLDDNVFDFYGGNSGAER